MPTLYYRTKHLPADYGFEFEPRGDGSWRVYIVSQPPYGSRAADQHTAHWLSEDGRKYICWTTPLRSFQTAKTVAEQWADRTQRYIASGTPIEAPWA